MRGVAAGLAAAVLLTACQPGAGEEQATDPLAALPRAAQQDLGVAVGPDPFLRAIRPPSSEVRTDAELGVAVGNVGVRRDGPNLGIFETLTVPTAGFGVAPGLAERWEAQSEATWRFWLRPDVTFHNGAPFDAPAVVQSLELVARRQTRPRGLEPGSARVIDDHLVEIRLSAPNLRLPEQLADPSTAILAPGTEPRAGGEPATTPTGTGPFRFVSYAPGDRLEVEANPDYWGDEPELDRIVFRFGPAEDASRLLATRDVDLVGHVPLSTLARVSGRTDRVAASRPGRSVFLLLNVGGAGEWDRLSDDRLRRAVALAIDRDALTATAWPEHGEPSTSVIPPAVLGDAVEGTGAIEHDPAAARDLLADAGWEAGPDGLRQRDGEPLVLRLVRSPQADAAAAVEPLRRQLAAVGIELVEVDPGEESFAAFARVNAATFDLFLDVRTQSDANPCTLCRFFSILPGGQLTYAGAVGAGPDADALFETAYRAPSLESARRAAAEMMRVVATEAIVAVPIAALPNVWLAAARVEGFAPAPVPGAQRWDTVWLGL